MWGGAANALGARAQAIHGPQITQNTIDEPAQVKNGEAIKTLDAQA